MAPPRKSLALSEIKAAAVASAVMAALEAHVKACLGNDWVMVLPPAPTTPLGQAVFLWVVYAQRGWLRTYTPDLQLFVEGFEGGVLALGTRRRFVLGMSRQIRHCGFLHDGDLRERLETIYHAAWTRAVLAEGGEINPTGLAALASLSVRRVQKLIAQGELSAELPNEEVKVWLATRGVPGFEQETRR